ncbi:MAG TPA: DUF4465 domain-containing protein [Pirellulales bacterium]|jgi:hypothetical protein
MRTCLLLILAIVSTPASAETVNFNDLSLAPHSYVSGPLPNASTVDGPYGPQDVGTFTSGGAQFGNTYDETFGSWSGFAYSDTTDTTTPGYTNQYSAITGGGVPGSNNYAVAFGYLDQTANQAQPFDFNPADPAQLEQLPTITLPTGYEIQNIDVTNSTYAALSMLNGDSFAKKFGGPTGNDPDYFKLSVYGTDSAGHALTNSVDFYLADYQFANKSLDYIVTTWQSVNLSALSDATHLYFNLSSSDAGDFGMNTPGFFALGSMQLAAITNIKGDVNNDGVVNGLDINAVASHWLQTGTGIQGDANNDGVVNGLDINLMATHWLQTTDGGNAQTVPEPATIVLAGAAGVALLIYRRRQ